MATRLRMSITADPDQRQAALLQRLRQAGRGDLQRQMNAELRKLGRPALGAVRAGWKRATLAARPSRGGGRSTKLRARVARNTSVITTDGVRIRVNGKGVDPAYGTSLVLALNGTVKLRHPVYGNRRRWVEQRGGDEVFYAALRPFEQRWQRGAEDVLDRFAAKIQGR